MGGDVMFGRCECCGKEKPLQRTYFRYPINCQCHNNQHFELIDHCADCMPQKPKETKVCLSVQQIDEIAALREENDLQRHSIQQLSAQVAAYREAIADAIYHLEYGDTWTTEKLKNTLSQPDPGAKIRERMKKLEAAAEAAKEVFRQIDLRTHAIGLDMSNYHAITIRVKQGDSEYWQALWEYNKAQALAELTGDVPCP